MGIGLAGKADDEGRAQREFGTLRAPTLDPRQSLLLRGRALHGFEDFRACVLERDIEIGQHVGLGHAADDLVDMGVRVNVLQPHPYADLTKGPRKIEKPRAYLAILPSTGGIFTA